MRLYFCSDLHASRKCWKKFLASWSFYGADHIIVGGDITGKFIVPIVDGPRGVKAAIFLGVERRVETADELSRLKQRIADSGQYAFETTPDEQAWFAQNPDRVDELFRRLVLERLEEWIAEAEDRLAGTGVRVFVSGANDDFLEVDHVLARSERIEDPNGRVVELEGGLELLGMGWGNPTPWNCPRDIPEEELAARIDAVVEKVRDPSRAIFSLHVPPFDTGLDVAPLLDDYLRPRVSAAGVQMVPVGSTATREAIVKYRPLIGLHGHIHESKGVKRLEGVPIANPGSEYGEGVLDGLIVDIEERTGAIHNIELVSG